MKPRAWCAVSLLLLLPAVADAAFYVTREAQLARLDPEIGYRVEDPAKPMTFESCESRNTIETVPPSRATRLG